MAKMTKKRGIGTINPNYAYDDEKDDKRRQVEVGRIDPLIVYPQHLHPPCRVHSSRLGCNINMMMIIMMMVMIIMMIRMMIHTSNLSFFLQGQNFWRIKFTPKNATFSHKICRKCQFFASNL